MNKKGFQLPVNFIIFALICLAAFVILFLGFSPQFRTLTSTLFNFFGDDEKQENEISVDEANNTRYYDLFLEDFKKCLNSKSENCYCPITNTYLAGQTIEITNTETKLSIWLYASSEEDPCTQPTGKLLKKEIINNKQIYFEDSYGVPSIENGMLDSSDFTKADRLFFSKSKICSTKDVSGNNEIEFSKGIFYKLNKDVIALTRSQPGLKICAAQ